MQSPYKIGVVQTSFINEDIASNLQKMKIMIEKSKFNHQDIKFVLFPELAATGYDLSPQIRDFAEPQDGPICAFMAEMAIAYDVYIGYGYPESGEKGEIYNSFILINPAGQPVANYRKIHLTSLEKGIFEAGHQFISVQTELGKIGLLICWDLAFPESARNLAVSGADLILAPSAWERPYQQPYQRFAMARALDNTVFLATCNHVGQSGELSFFGRSAIYGPDGSVIESLEEDIDDICIAEINPQKREAYKQDFFSMLEERRTDLY